MYYVVLKLLYVSSREKTYFNSECLLFSRRWSWSFFLFPLNLSAANRIVLVQVTSDLQKMCVKNVNSNVQSSEVILPPSIWGHDAHETAGVNLF